MIQRAIAALSKIFGLVDAAEPTPDEGTDVVIEGGIERGSLFLQ